MEDFIPYIWAKLSHEEHIDKSNALFKEMNKRRSIREFSDEIIPAEA